MKFHFTFRQTNVAASIMYQNAAETLEPAVNHQRATQISSSDHVLPRETDVDQLIILRSIYTFCVCVAMRVRVGSSEVNFVIRPGP